MVKRDQGIEQHHGQKHRVNEGHTQHMPPLRHEHISEQALLEALLLGQHLLVKTHLVLFKVGLPLLPAAFRFLFNGSLQLQDAVQKFLNRGIHGGSLGQRNRTKGQFLVAMRPHQNKAASEIAQDLLPTA